MKFNSVTDTPLDPIMRLDQVFRADADSRKINLVIGVYQDETGQSPVLESVKAAEKKLLKTEQTKVYVPIPGEKEFLSAAENLVFGLDGAQVNEKCIASLNTPGSTAAIRLAGDFFAEHFPDRSVWISDPAYPNHRGIMSAVGLNCKSYQYFDFEQGKLTFNAMVDDLSAAESGDIVVLHGCCHNPTGADLSLEQWKEIALLLKNKGLLPLVDLAYLGYADGLDKDADGVKAIFEQCREGIVTTSFSKNFALYGERVGLMTFIADSHESAARCVAKTRSYVRRIYTSPPVHGGRIITTILNDENLRKIWVNEVSVMRERLSSVRQSLSDALQARGVDMSFFPGLTSLKGMFALTRLEERHVIRLREEYHIYLLPNGRISIAGIRSTALDYIADAFASVLST